MNAACMNSHHRICRNHFSAKTLRALSNKNLFLVSATFVVGTDGTYANGETAYLLSNGKLATFLEVLKLAS